MYAANFRLHRYVLHFFEGRLASILRIPAIALLCKSWFSFSKSTSFIILSYLKELYICRNSKKDAKTNGGQIEEDGN